MRFLPPLRSTGKPPTDPTRSAIVERRGAAAPRETLRRSRTTSDFERLRPRDSASISATSASGSRTVSVFMGTIVLHRRQRRKTGRAQGRTAGASIGMPRARHIRYSSRSTSSGAPYVVRLRAHADEAVAQPALERAQALPLQPVERIAGRVRLRDDVAGELAAPVVVVALAQARLSWPWRRSKVARPASRNGCVRAIDRDVDRQAARLARDVGGQREQLLALPGERRRLLPLDAAAVDALLEVDRPARAASNAG